MHKFAPLPHLLAALSLAIPLLSAAQAPALTDAERARRDAEKVLSFIKFQTVRSKPVAEPGDKPRRPAAPGPQRQASTTRHAEAAVATPAEPAAAVPSQALAGADALTVADRAALTATEQPAASIAAPAASLHGAALAAEAEPDTDAREEVALQIQRFVEPVLPPSVQATLAGGSRKVTVRFTVEADGTVSKAEAAEDVPRRLARHATEAVLQWQFAPLPHSRMVDVEIAFRRG